MRVRTFMTRGIAVLWALALGLGFGLGGAMAQSCTADSQCAPPGRERTYSCQGSVLVSHERRCLGGRCTSTPEMRIDCGGGVGLGNCDPSSGRCRARPGDDRASPDAGIRSECPPRCICRGKSLIQVTGKAGAAGKRCETNETQCERGCSCLPTPHCLAPGEAQGRRPSVELPAATTRVDKSRTRAKKKSKKARRSE